MKQETPSHLIVILTPLIVILTPLIVILTPLIVILTKSGSSAPRWRVRSCLSAG